MPDSRHVVRGSYINTNDYLKNNCLENINFECDSLSGQFNKIDIINCKFKTTFKNIKLHGAYVQNCVFDFSIFENCVVYRTNFHASSFKDVKFNTVSLASSQFYSCNMLNTTFMNIVLDNNIELTNCMNINTMNVQYAVCESISHFITSNRVRLGRGMRPTYAFTSDNE